MAIRFGLEDHQHFKVESQSRNGPKALTGVPGAMRSLGTSLNQTSLTPINPPRTLHLRTSEKRGVLHRMEVLSHLSHHSLGSVGGAWFPITQQSYSHQLTVPTRHLGTA